MTDQQRAPRTLSTKRADLCTDNVQCRNCRRVFTLTMNTQDCVEYNAGTLLVQQAFPYLTTGERELIINRMCGECFDKFFEKGDDPPGEMPDTTLAELADDFGLTVEELTSRSYLPDRLFPPDVRAHPDDFNSVHPAIDDPPRTLHPANDDFHLMTDEEKNSR